MTETKHNMQVNGRSDGAETKALLIECAGKLIAQNGFAKTTSKEICTMAQVNLAAVNYHFGSRDGLYLAVLKEVHAYLMNIDLLNSLYKKQCSPQEKLREFLDFYISNVLKESNWHVKVWAREMLAPSPMINEIFNSEAIPKLRIVLLLFAEYLELPLNDTRLYSCIVSTMAPFAMIFLSGNSPMQQYLSRISEVPHLLTTMQEFALLSLCNYKKTVLKK